jgi:hypothetical protein
MNERIKELMNQSMESTGVEGLGGSYMELNPKKFAELIVKECIYTLQLKIVRNGYTPENLRSLEHIKDLGEKFGIEFPMDYYPDRNKHFGVES